MHVNCPSASVPVRSVYVATRGESVSIDPLSLKRCRHGCTSAQHPAYCERHRRRSNACHKVYLHGAAESLVYSKEGAFDRAEIIQLPNLRESDSLTIFRSTPI